MPEQSIENTIGQSQPQSKLKKVGTIGAYGIGQIGLQLSWYMLNSYLLLFYTDVVGLAATAISLIMLISQIWEAVVNPAIGLITDRTHSRWGRFRPYFLFAPPFLAVFNVLTFTVVPLHGAAKIIWCFVTYILVGTIASLLGVASGGLINTLSSDSHMRNFLITAKALGSTFGKIIISAIAMPLVLYFGNGKKVSAPGYFGTAIVFSLLLMPCLWICGGLCKEMPNTRIKKGAAHTSIKESFKLAAKNKPLILTYITIFTMMLAIAGRTSLFSYYIIYVAGNVRWVAKAMTLLVIMQFIGSFLISEGTKLFGGRRSYMIVLNIINIICLVTMFLSPAKNMTTFMVLTAIIGFCQSSSNISPGLAADSIDYGYWKTGHYEPGLAQSLTIFTTKIASAIFQTVGVLMLAAVGYVAGIKQTAATMRGISAIVNIVPAILLGLSLIPLFMYKLNNKSMAKIKEEIDERDSKKEAAADTK